MISADVLKRIKEVEIHTRRILNGMLVGDSRSAIKGSGFEFDQIREYQAGDDVRFIDWKASARSTRLLVKQYIEERSRSVIIALDVSCSGLFSHVKQSKYDVMAEIAAVLSLVADYSKDSVGLLLFGAGIECYMPPKKGRPYIHAILQRLFEHKLTATKTVFRSPLEYLRGLKRRDMLVVLISDFIDIRSEPDIEKLLGAVKKKGDVVAIRCLDSFEQDMPGVGFVTVQDLESGQQVMLDVRAGQREKLNNFLHDRSKDQLKMFNRCGINCLDVAPGKSFIGDIIQFFRQRMTL